MRVKEVWRGRGKGKGRAMKMVRDGEGKTSWRGLGKARPHCAIAKPVRFWAVITQKGRRGPCSAGKSSETPATQWDAMDVIGWICLITLEES